MRVRARGSKEQGQKEVAANIKGDGIMTTTTTSAKVKDADKNTQEQGRRRIRGWEQNKINPSFVIKRVILKSRQVRSRQADGEHDCRGS